MIRFESGKYYQNFDEELNYVFFFFFLTGQAALRSSVMKMYYSDSDVEVVVVYFSVRKLELDI